VPPLMFLFRTVNGLEKIASQEIREKLSVTKLILSPYGSHGWIKCETDDYWLDNIRKLRSVSEAHMILYEENYGRRFSIDTFADRTVGRIPVYAPQAQRISVSAYSSHGKPSQREIQGAFSNRIIEKLNAECNLKDYDTALRITLLGTVAIATIDLEIQPGNLPKNIITHPTPLLPPIAYCMIKLSSPQENERLLDPMCGCGTIPLMTALEWKDLEVIGSDIENDYVSCARRNAKTLGITDRVKFLTNDVADLTDAGIAADIVVVNPPYGISLPAQSQVERLYDTLLQASYKVLSSRGRIIVVTPYPWIIERTAFRSMFEIDSAYKIHEGEPPRTIQVIRKA